MRQQHFEKRMLLNFRLLTDLCRRNPTNLAGLAIRLGLAEGISKRKSYIKRLTLDRVARNSMITAKPHLTRKCKEESQMLANHKGSK